MIARVGYAGGEVMEEPRMAAMHEIVGEDLQFVKIELDPREAVVAEAGSMMYIEDGIQMDTVFGDGSQQNQGFMGCAARREASRSRMLAAL